MSDAPLEFQHASIPFIGGFYRAYGLTCQDPTTIPQP